MNTTTRLRATFSRHSFVQYRQLHIKQPQQQSLAQDIPPTQIPTLSLKGVQTSKQSKPASATAHLSFPALLKTYIFTAATSSPLIIAPSIKILSAIAYSKSAFLSPDRNRLLHWLLKRTVYKHFCAGENALEVHQTLSSLKKTGIAGIILCYAKEVELRGDEPNSKIIDQPSVDEEIEAWADGVRRTINLVPEDNFVSIKFSGAGARTLHHLQHGLSPPPELARYLDLICSEAHRQKIRICFDAEQSKFQAGIDTWTIDLMRKWNKSSWPCIYNTYQTYLVSSPHTLSQHLRLASKESFNLGVKLVRGAYLASEPRSLFWPDKEATDKNFDTLAKGLIQREWYTITENQSPSTSIAFPDIGLVLATHNLASCRSALALQQQASHSHSGKVDMVYAQLQGMADHVTGELVGAAKRAEEAQIEAEGQTREDSQSVIPRVCKYLTWGTVGECSKYLVRRAEENRDAVARTIEARKALGAEIGRRIRGMFGLT